MTQLRVLAILLVLGAGQAQGAETWDRLIGAEAALARELSRVDTVLACQDLADRIAIVRGQLTPAAAEARLKALGRELHHRPVSDQEIADARARLGAAITGYLDAADHAVATSTRWPQPDSAARARQLLTAVRASYPRWLQSGLDPAVLLSQVALAVGWARGESQVGNPFGGHRDRMRDAYPDPRTRARLAAAAGPLAAPGGQPVPAQAIAPPAPGATGAVPSRSAPSPAPSTAPSGGAPASTQAGEDEHAFWRRVYAADTREGYEQYLRAYPRGQYADIARAALGDLAAPRSATPAGATPAIASSPGGTATPTTPPAPPPPADQADVRPGPGVTTAPPSPPTGGLPAGATITLPPGRPRGGVALAVPPYMTGGAAPTRSLGESLQLGSALLSHGQFREALVAFDEALRVDANAVDALLGRGRALNGLGDVDGAIPAYEAALRVDPSRPNVRAWIGELAIARNDLRRAETAIAEELRLFPRSAWAYSFLGTIRMLEGRQAEGAQAMAIAMRLDPAVAAQRHQNAQFLGSMGYHQRALTEFTSVVLLDPNAAGAYYGIGASAAQLGQIGTAIQAYEAYLARDGASEWAQRARQEVARLRAQVGTPAGGGCPPGRLAISQRCVEVPIR